MLFDKFIVGLLDRAGKRLGEGGSRKGWGKCNEYGRLKSEGSYPCLAREAWKIRERDFGRPGYRSTYPYSVREAWKVHRSLRVIRFIGVAIFV